VTLANKITLLRLLLTPVFVIGLLEGARGWPTALFILSVLTDMADGLAARLKKEKTTLGGLLDPAADKLLLVTTYLVFAHLGRVPLWIFVVIFSRDLFIVLGWSLIFILTRKILITPRWLGKSTTFMEMSTAVLLLLSPAHPLVDVFLWITIALAGASLADYTRLGMQKMNEMDAVPAR